MKIAICYYSSTGNTQLACRYIARKLNAEQITLIDVIKNRNPDLAPYQVVGFAAPTIYWGLPGLIRDFIERLPAQDTRPAFVFNTFGMLSGQTLHMLERVVTPRGFQVIAGHSLHTPENYPPMIVRGLGNAGAPTPKEMAAFDQFAARLARQLNAIEAGQPAQPVRIKMGLVERLTGPRPDGQARQDIGLLKVDKTRCTGCGTCRQACPYGVLEFDAGPVFHPERCQGCWTCFNRCPKQAIYTDKIKRGTGYYPRPTPQFAAKLEA